jgi:hypothetical protein
MRNLTFVVSVLALKIASRQEWGLHYSLSP